MGTIKKSINYNFRAGKEIRKQSKVLLLQLGHERRFDLTSYPDPNEWSWNVNGFLRPGYPPPMESPSYPTFRL